MLRKMSVLAAATALVACGSGGAGGGAFCGDAGPCSSSGGFSGTGIGGIGAGTGIGASAGVGANAGSGSQAGQAGSGGIAGETGGGGASGSGGVGAAGQGGQAGSEAGGSSGSGASGGSGGSVASGGTAGTISTGGGGAGGTPACQELGSSCTVGKCCDPLVCDNGFCKAACVPQGASCSTTGQCCNGLKCAANLCQNIASCMPSQVVISEVYGGGGSVSGSAYANDFVELHNRGVTPVDITGWSLQYAAATGVSWAVAGLTGTIPAGGYFLVQLQSAGGGTGAALPTPDQIAGLSLSQTSGKVALVKNKTPLASGCPIPSSDVADFVGYGSADCSEGSLPAPSPTTTLSIQRASNACADTDVSTTDFATASPAPKNALGSSNNCGCG